MDFFMLGSGFENSGNIVRETELVESLDNVVARNRLLGFLL